MGGCFRQTGRTDLKLLFNGSLGYKDTCVGLQIPVSFSLCFSLKNKDFWPEDSLNSSWNWNDQPKILAINLTVKLSAIKRHSCLPPNQAGNMIDSVNLHQAISDILDPLLLCD